MTLEQEDDRYQENLRRDGMCGDRAPEGHRHCLKNANHSTPHGWEENAFGRLKREK